MAKHLFRRETLIGMMFITLVVSGCRSVDDWKQSVEYFENDPALQSAAFQLADDYLKGQMAGEGFVIARKRFGSGAERIYQLYEFHCDSLGSALDSPAIFCRIRTEKQESEKAWTPFTIFFDYFPHLRKAKDPYEGLRIQMVGDGRF